MKIALIGQDIPMLLPGILTDIVYAGREAAEIAVQEGNAAMRGVLQRYADAVVRRSGVAAKVTVDSERRPVLKGADCLIYAGDCMPASRFAMDREALSGGGGEHDDPQGLLDQARADGGIGGLLHTLRAGGYVLDLCEEMRTLCPNAVVIDLGRPVGRMTEIFAAQGFSAYGLAKSPLRGAAGLDGLAARLGKKSGEVRAKIAGLTGFEFLLELTDTEGNDLLPALYELAEHEQLGRLVMRWLDWYGAVAVGDLPAHAELLPEEEDFIPEERPQFGETVEQRKERILHMNTVGGKGAGSPDGAAAQGALLMRVPAIRPARLALALLRGEDLEMPAVTRRNRGELPQLPADAVISSDLTLKAGREVPHGYALPQPLAEICGDIDSAARLAAKAASGDREALRVSIETDPALSGLDRLYIEDVTEKMIGLHADVLERL